MLNVYEQVKVRCGGHFHRSENGVVLREPELAMHRCAKFFRGPIYFFSFGPWNKVTFKSTLQVRIS